MGNKIMSRIAILVLSFVLIFTLQSYVLQSVINIERLIHSHNVTEFKQGWTDLTHPGLLKYIRHLIDNPPENATKYDERDVSQENQATYVDELLKGKRNGFYIECGAADGMLFSNSRLFESKRGWTGLLVEPNPNLYKSLIDKHRNAYSLNACLSTSNQTEQVDFLTGAFLGGIVKNFENKQHFEYAKEASSLNEENTKTIRVQCFPLYSVLLALGQTHVDMFSLDVEGPELEILQTIPLNIIIIDVFVIEYKVWYGWHDVKQSDIKLNKIRAFFNNTGLYKEVKKTGLDVFFKRKY